MQLNEPCKFHNGPLPLDRDSSDMNADLNRCDSATEENSPHHAVGEGAQSTEVSTQFSIPSKYDFTECGVPIASVVARLFPNQVAHPTPSKIVGMLLDVFEDEYPKYLIHFLKEKEFQKSYIQDAIDLYQKTYPIVQMEQVPAVELCLPEVNLDKSMTESGPAVGRSLCLSRCRSDGLYFRNLNLRALTEMESLLLSHVLGIPRPTGKHWNTIHMGIIASEFAMEIGASDYLWMVEAVKAHSSPHKGRTTDFLKMLCKNPADLIGIIGGDLTRIPWKDEIRIFMWVDKAWSESYAPLGDRLIEARIFDIFNGVNTEVVRHDSREINGKTEILVEAILSPFADDSAGHDVRIMMEFNWIIACKVIYPLFLLSFSVEGEHHARVAHDHGFGKWFSEFIGTIKMILNFCVYGQPVSVRCITGHPMFGMCMAMLARQRADLTVGNEYFTIDHLSLDKDTLPCSLEELEQLFETELAFVVNLSMSQFNPVPNEKPKFAASAAPPRFNNRGAASHVRQEKVKQPVSTSSAPRKGPVKQPVSASSAPRKNPVKQPTLPEQSEKPLGAAEEPQPSKASKRAKPARTESQQARDFEQNFM